MKKQIIFSTIILIFFFFKVDSIPVALDPDLDTDPDLNWAKILGPDPDPNSMYLDPQHWLQHTSSSTPAPTLQHTNSCPMHTTPASQLSTTRSRTNTLASEHLLKHTSFSTPAHTCSSTPVQPHHSSSTPSKPTSSSSSTLHTYSGPHTSSSTHQLNHTSSPV